MTTVPRPPATGGLSGRCWNLARLGLLGLLSAPVGCGQSGSQVQMDSPEVAAYVQLVMPARIEIQPHWTKPVDFTGDGSADALEVILKAYDATGDLTKMVGTLHVELYTRRMASADRLAQRVAFWPVEFNSAESLTRHWDPLARFYFLQVKLAEAPLPVGRYILVARLQVPGQPRLEDEYEFTHEAGVVPPASQRP
jgi:hypothetical protein